MRRSTRSSYHKQIKFIKRNNERLQKEKVVSAFRNKDTREFWGSLRRMRGQGKINSYIVEGQTDSQSISNCFADSYKLVYNQVGYNSNEMYDLYSNVTNDIIECTCTGMSNMSCITHTISSKLISESVKGMKPGKNDGFDGLTSDYLKNGSEMLFNYLSLLFTCMLRHSFSPSTFCISTMIPIPKGINKDLTKTQNYRGIALSSLLSKLFDLCIISSEGSHLLSDGLQFAYKSGSSTIQCASIVTETINYYINNESDVYMCCIDASKAFDRVNLVVLFNKLRKRNICPLYLRFLMNNYCNQTMMVRWNDTLSEKFTVSNGVKQGGVLSPILFSLYLDSLIDELRSLNVGCHVNGLFVGAVVYADDITLL